MTEVPLFPGFSETTSQWRAQRMQLVNWGGFHGHHGFDLAAGSTLISGASGTGKSTLLDAYLALMMPPTVPFNGASNDATQGRARGADQRNVLSYLRGLRDTAHDGEKLTEQVMRGADAPTWGAIAVTFTDEMHRVLTVARVYLAPASARRSTEVLMRMFTVPAALDLRSLEAFADKRFDPRSLRAAFDGMATYDTASRFLDAVTTRLGIGAGDGGEKALRLLARIQAGQQVRTVDSLYKQMVLEEPSTFRVAGAAVEQFASLDTAYTQLEEDAAKAHALARMEELHGHFRSSQERAERLDRFGLGRKDGATGFDLWGTRVESELLAQSEQENRGAAEQIRHRVLQAEEDVARLQGESSELARRRRDEDGGEGEVLASRAKQAGLRLERVRSARADFDLQLQAAGEDCSSAKDHAAVVARARDFLDQRDLAEARLRAERDDHVAAAPGLKQRRAELMREHDSLRRREGSVPMVQDAARRMIAQAAGLDPHELPFAAELMDVAPEYSSWRPAAEVTLRGVGLTMLMDSRRQAQLRVVLDELSLPTRIQFEGVDLGAVTDAEPLDSSMISGRLVFKDSPFSGWVRRRVQRPGTDHLCVDSAEELGGDQPKVTAAGQTSSGRRGAHGRSAGAGDVLGFSNTTRQATIEDEVRSITETLVEHDDARAAVDQDLAKLRAKADAYAMLLASSWDAVDVDSAVAHEMSARAAADAAAAESDVVAALVARQESVAADLDAALRVRAAAHVEQEKIETQWAELVERQDTVSDRLAELEPQDGAMLDEEDAAYLDAMLASEVGEPELARWQRTLRTLRSRLVEDSDRERRAAAQAAGALEAVFSGFDERWPDSDRGTTVASYPEYRALLDAIEANGLHRRREEFRQQFQSWSGNDLKLLADAFDASLADIEERLEPVNEILSGLPFGPQADRLRIVVRRLHPQSLVAFRAELKELATGEIPEAGEEAEELFRRLRQFMALLSATDGEARARRDEMLDVRRHLEITAARVDRDGRELAVYSSLGGKSGGESQELVAFIVGSALRYQLGDDTRTRPRFAPVFLDEGFVKSDAQFAGRAMAAWRGLGFQLIVGAPLDKVTALEPHMDLSLSVTKDRVTGYSFITPFLDAERSSDADVDAEAEAGKDSAEEALARS
ncbi:MAG: ATP-binding protein [Galactobacter sp.]